MSAPKFATYPEQFVLAGRYCRLEPLGPQHAGSLFAAISGEAAEARFRYTSEYPPADIEELERWIARMRIRPDRLYSAVIDSKSGACVGRQALLDARPEHRAVELGSVMWGEGAARTRVATEAVFLTIRHVFETLNYRRLEWKCDAENEASRNAAIRFGFRPEGVFRQHMLVKGRNRDTAWFSMLDSEWPDLKPLYETWLAKSNFDRKRRQKKPLATPRAEDTET